MTKSIHDALQAKLNRIYGDDIGQATYEKMSSLLQPLQSGTVEKLAVSGKDVILICYGDHVHDEDHPPLHVLHHFLKKYVHPQVNTIHILPFYPWSSDDGFSVIDYYQVDTALGNWQHITAMKDDFRLMFDAVFNHMSAQSSWFQKYLIGQAPYDKYFIDIAPETDLTAVVRPRALPLLTPFETHEGIKHIWTTFSPDQIDLNVENPDVLLEFLKIIRFYIENGAEFIRLDAIAFLWKKIGTSSIHLDETHLIIQVMRDVLNLIAPDVLIITETNVPHDENINYFGNGINEAQMVYQFPLPPLILHTMAAGDSTHLTNWAKSLDPIGERTTFFNFTASHDGIGLRPVTGILTQVEIDRLVQRTQTHGGNVSYKANGDGSQSPYEMNITYFDAITDPNITASHPQSAIKRFVVAQAIQLSLAGVPGIYFSSLFGGRNWNEGVAESGRFRTINREKFKLDSLTADLTGDTLRGKVFKHMIALLEKRRSILPFIHWHHKQSSIVVQRFLLFCDNHKMRNIRFSRCTMSQPTQSPSI
ncbi:MAG: sugar phosphorylase [Anaerolineae bacterium]|nr:sugar phosphorylase [Anaerolineae bacterium]